MTLPELFEPVIAMTPMVVTIAIFFAWRFLLLMMGCWLLGQRNRTGVEQLEIWQFATESMMES